MEKKLTKEQLAEHQRNVVSAAYTYHNIHWMTINGLAESFKVSRNQIAEWLCEAVSKRYVADDEMCESIRRKHIQEYESSLNIEDSSLRTKYKEAFACRKVVSAPQPDFIAAVTA